ncbi:MAG: hypothetical protein WDN49_19195 [Acetobacteraceae bacterium]
MIADAVVHPARLDHAAIKIDVAQASSAGPAPAAPPAVPIATLLASADPAAGATYAKQVCSACHTFDEGGRGRRRPQSVQRGRRPACAYAGV